MNDTVLKNKLGEWYHTEGITRQDILNELTVMRSQEADTADMSLSEAYDLLEENISNPRMSMDTPFVWLNKKIYGLTKGDLVTFAARPGAGKSTFALQILSHVSKKYKTLYVTLEMPETQQAGRTISAVSDITQDEILHGKILDIDLFQSIKESLKNTPTAENMRLTRSANTTEKILALIEKGNIDVVVIDTLNLMHSKGETERVKLMNITRELKQIALQKDIAIVMVAQLNREADDKVVPALRDLKESGSIEEDSDVVLMFADVEKYSEVQEIERRFRGVSCSEHELLQMRENNRRCVFVTIRKNRNGETGGALFWYVCDKFKFVELAEARERYFAPW